MKRKKKILLETAIILALSAGYAHAGINPGVHDEFQKVENEGDKAIISESGEYTFTNGAELTSDYNATLKLGTISPSANGELTINIGNNYNKSDFKIISDSSEYESGWNPRNSAGIKLNSGSSVTINVQNANIELNGSCYSSGIAMAKNSDFILIGDGKTDLKIAGDVMKGIDGITATDSQVSISGINNFSISSTKELDTTQIGYGNINAIRGGSAAISIESNNFTIGDENSKIVQFASGISSSSEDIFIKANNNFKINSVETGINMFNGGNIKVEADTISINGMGADNQEDGYAVGQGIYQGAGYLSLNAKNDINISGPAEGVEFSGTGSNEGDLNFEGEENWGKADIISQEGNINISSSQFVGISAMIKPMQQFAREVNISAKKDINVYGADKGVFYEPGSREMDINSEIGNISISSDNIGFLVTSQERTGSVGTQGRDVTVEKGELRSNVDISALNGTVKIFGTNKGLVVDNIQVNEKKQDENGIWNITEKGYFTTFNIDAQNVKITGANDYGIMAQNVLSRYENVSTTADRNSYVDIDAANTVEIYGGKAGILASLTKSKEEGSQTVKVINTNLSSNVDLNAQNVVIGSKEYGVLALEKGNVNIDSVITNITSEQTGINVEDASIVNITANSAGILAKDDGIRTGSGGTVTVKHQDNTNGNDYLSVTSDLRALTAASNDGSNGGCISVTTDKISLYGNNKVDDNQYTGGAADDQLRVQAVVFGYNSDIDLAADTINIVSKNTEKIDDSDNRLYAAVQSRGASDINIAGNSTIMSENGVALYATKLKQLGNIQLSDDKQSVINLADKDNEGNYLSHNIMGDIVAGKDSEITIGGKGNFVGAANGANAIEVLAANGGKVDLGLQDGVLIGRVDDYYQVKDANTSNDMGLVDTAFRNNKLYTDISTSGEITLNMNENSTWYNIGQSYVSNVNLNGGTIDLGQDKGSSVNIGKLSGTGTFNMYLNSAVIDSDDYVASDMLYIQDVDLSNDTDGKFTVNAVGKDVLTYLDYGDKLRFATVGGENADKVNFVFNTVKDNGIKNVDFIVGHDEYDKAGETETNEKYNGGSTSELKPGNTYVDNEFGGSTASTFDTITDGATVTAGAGENYYITRDKESDNVNDVGKTIINMSRANYQNAVYMDRLNKRLGEARYIDGDEGMWVRLRHDRIGMKDEFRSMNTMYQLGYDKLDNKDNKGERHIGAAIDYMDGSTSYSNIYGEGETRRWGFWMYDTWLGNKGHYADYVAKFGHMHNEFDITSLNTGEKITGDYDNNVFSISAEYGRKKDIGNNWYFEPQAQLQLARVTDAEYKTSQDTDVYVDGINSLIGRAGFRLGKDVDERSTVYVKADVLHEFLGDQRITASDVTGSLDKTYENKGTWYDIGFGFATAVGHDSYAYLDFEKSFGNDNDDTYQINAGLQWNF